MTLVQYINFSLRALVSEIWDDQRQCTYSLKKMMKKIIYIHIIYIYIYNKTDKTLEQAA